MSPAEPVRAEDSMSKIKELQAAHACRQGSTESSPPCACKRWPRAQAGEGHSRPTVLTGAADGAWRRGHRIMPVHTATASPLPLIQVLLPHLRVLGGHEPGRSYVFSMLSGITTMTVAGAASRGPERYRRRPILAGQRSQRLTTSLMRSRWKSCTCGVGGSEPSLR